VKRLEGSLGSFDGQWNFENWIRLLDCLAASSTASEEYIRVTFERTLAVFPNAYGVWIKYVTWETLLPDSSRSVGRIEELFSRCLKSVLHPELFRFYLEYMKKVNKSGTEFTAEGRTAVMKAYEFTLNSIGLDMDSSDIWLDYLNFLRKWQVRNK
jgi:cleavage stimulation factor subunit 3